MPGSKDNELVNGFTNDELCYMPVATQIKFFKSGAISPVDVLNAQILKIEQHDRYLHAVSDKHYDDARKQAEESAARYAVGNPRSLEGITCAIKDQHDVVGWRTTMGSLLYKNAQAAMQDTALITLLREAGVVMHVQTTVPEFYCNLVTWNKLTGISRNPWNISYTPGGSSGGSAASLAAGFTTLATGSDIGGSIRFPAAMSGLYGFKPPFGRIASSLIPYESSGPMARTFEDLNYFQDAIAKPTPYFITPIKPKLHYPHDYGAINGWKIAYDPMINWGLPIDDVIRNAMNAAVKTLQTAGAIVDEVDVGFRVSDFDTYAPGIFSSSFGHFCLKDSKQHLDAITPYMQAIVNRYGNVASSKCTYDLESWVEAHHTVVQEKVFSKGYKAIIMPTMCTPYVIAELGSAPDNSSVIINGKAYTPQMWEYSFTWPWNILPHYPVVNVPIGQTKENIPMGMQVIADTYEDLTAFQVASAWSKHDPCRFFEGKRYPKLQELNCVDEQRSSPTPPMV